MLSWDGLSGVVEYHVYRGESPIGYSDFGSCQDGLDGDRTDLQVVDPGTPPVNKAWYYLITGEDALGNEGTLGFAPGAEKSRFAPCP